MSPSKTFFLVLLGLLFTGFIIFEVWAHRYWRHRRKVLDDAIDQVLAEMRQYARPIGEAGYESPADRIARP